MGEAYLVLGYKLVRLRHCAAVFLCQICGTQGLKIGSFLRDDELDIRSLLLDEADDMAISGDSSHQDDLALADSRLLQEVDDLHSHHVA